MNEKLRGRAGRAERRVLNEVDAGGSSGYVLLLTGTEYVDIIYSWRNRVYVSITVEEDECDEETIDIRDGK